MFYTFFNHLDDGTRSKFMNGTELGQWLTDQRAVQPSTKTSTGWREPERNLMVFNREKSRVLPLGRSSHRNRLESNSPEKGLKVLVDMELNMSQQ